jgi:hypothetical protein
MVSTFSSLYRTYSGGYHSLRQIFLGTLLAIASHRVSVGFLENSESSIPLVPFVPLNPATNHSLSYSW